MSLSTNELAQLRTAHEAYLPDTCTLQTVTRTNDGQGGWTESWANTYTNIECRLAPMRSDKGEMVEGEQPSAFSAWVLTLHHDQTVDETMRVVHGSDTYEIVQMADTHSWRTAKRVYLRRLD